MAGTALNVAYDQMNMMYGASLGTSSKYDAHKKEDLRSTSDRISKSNRCSPLYKISESKDVKRFAIDIKEQAHMIKNIVASLSENGEGLESAISKKIATSNHPDVVTAEFVGDEASASAKGGFKLEVRQLATPQVNTGKFMRRNGHDFKAGSYSFDLNTNTTSYEFQYNVNYDDTNEQVLNKLRKLINNANIGLTADLISDERGNSKALQISSKQTGAGEDEGPLFTIVAGTDSASRSAMERLGIDQISSPAENSSFLLNGNEHSSYSNTFTVNNQFEITLNGVSEPGEPATIGFKPSADAVADNVETLIDAYNSMIDTANRYSDSDSSSGNLLSDVSRIARSFSSNFEAVGLSVNNDSTLSLNRDTLKHAIQTSNASATFDVLNKFRDALGRKADQASIDPMNYVKKIIVAYKNPDRTFATPYISSLYAGLLMDRNC